MKKFKDISIICFGIILCALSLIGVFKTHFSSPNNIDPENISSDPKNISYSIEGVDFFLNQGVAEKGNVLSASLTQKVSVVGEPIFGDINHTSDNDAVVILTHEPGGSGTFYYVSAAIFRDGKYVSTNTLFIGDRIKIQNIEFADQEFIVHYLDRRLDQDFSEVPMLAKSFRVKYNSQNQTILSVGTSVI